MTNRYIAIAAVADEAITLRLSGELDATAAPHLAAHLQPLVRAGAPLRLDLRDVTFIDTSGAEPLLESAAAMRESGSEVTVVRWSKPTARFRDALVAITRDATGEHDSTT